MAGLPLRAALVVLAALALFAAACSSDDSTPDTYRAEADEICRQAEQAFGAAPVAVDPSGAADELRKALPVLERQVSSLADLSPPGELAATHDESLELLREQLDLVSELIQRIDAGDEERILVAREIVPRLQGLAARADDKARELGLIECGQPAANGTAESPEEAAENAREDESPARQVFRANFVIACSQFYPAPTCNCIVDGISEDFGDDESFLDFAQRADNGEDMALARIADLTATCNASP